jgi:hypothetical protein
MRRVPQSKNANLNDDNRAIVRASSRFSRANPLVSQFASQR